MTSKRASTSDDLRATASFYDATAARYDAEVSAPVENMALRNAFRTRVSAIAGAGTAILDFGCGTGTDAAWYASRGHRVIAYDLSHGMVTLLRDRYPEEIETGRITALAGELQVLFAGLERTGPVAAVAANFAVLNHVRDLQPLLGALAPHVVPGGYVVASVLNPFYWRDMRQGWWWRGMPASLFTGAIRVAGEVTTYRHYVRAVRRMASPRFSLVEWMGLSNAASARSGSRDWVGVTLGDNFVLLLLKKC